MKIAGLFLLALIVATPIGAQPEKTSPNLAALIDAVLDSGTGDSLMSEYTYRLKITQRQMLRGAPIVGTALYETYAPTIKLKGETKFVLLKIEENGVSVSPRKLQEERERKSEELARVDEEARQQNEVAATSIEATTKKARTAYFTLVTPSGIRLSIETILRHSDFEFLRMEKVDGRATALLNFRLKPDTELDASEQWLTRVSGTLWIDWEDKVVTKLQAWASDDAERKRKPLAHYASHLMADGQWLPHEGRINGINNAAVFGNWNTDLTMSFSKYERFNADIQDVKITSPQRKP